MVDEEEIWSQFEAIRNETDNSASKLERQYNSEALHLKYQAGDARARIANLQCIRIDDFKEMDAIYQRKNSANPHTCSINCEQLHAITGQWILDPLTGKPTRATGNVYVCSAHWTVHICDRRCTSRVEDSSDRGILICPISKMVSGPILVNYQGFDLDEIRRCETVAINEATNSKPIKMVAPDARGFKRRGPSLKRNTKLQLSEPIGSVKSGRDSNKIVTDIICSGKLRTRLISAYDKHAKKTFDSCVRSIRSHKLSAGVPDAMSDFISATHAQLFALSEVAGTEVDVPEQYRSYLQACMHTIYDILLRSPETVRNQKDMNLRTLGMAILYTLKDGLCESVEYDAASGRPIRFKCESDTTDWHASELMDDVSPDEDTGMDYSYESAAVASSSSSPSGHLVTNKITYAFEFIPPHPWLSNILPGPNVFSLIQKEDDFSPYVRHIMKRRRVIQKCYHSFLTVNLDTLRATEYCLVNYVRIILSPSDVVGKKTFGKTHTKLN